MSADSAATVSRDMVIAADHPCLAGHFPGDPIVPGVVLLDNVAQLLRQWKPEQRVAAVAQAKFHQLLRPEQAVTIKLSEQSAHSIKFECFRGEEKIASGAMTVETRR